MASRLLIPTIGKLWAYAIPYATPAAILTPVNAPGPAPKVTPLRLLKLISLLSIKFFSKGMIFSECFLSDEYDSSIRVSSFSKAIDKS